MEQLGATPPNTGGDITSATAELPYEKEFAEFVQRMHDGLIIGLQDYGAYGFEKNDLMEMVIDELRDTACYAFFQFLKIRKLTLQLQELEAKGEQSNG